MSKVRWADMTDEDAFDIEPVVISKHGIKVKKPVVHEPPPAVYTPPHRKDKSLPIIYPKE